MYKVLLVDDEYLVRETLKTILKNHAEIGMIEEAASGKSALEKCASFNPDLVLLDTTVPGAEVSGLVKDMKRIAKNNSIVLLHDYASSQLVSEALAAGADDSLMKPARPEDILSMVKKYLPDHDHRRTIEMLLVRLLEYVFQENYKKAKEYGKTVAAETALFYRYDKRRLRETAELIFTGLQQVTDKKQLSIAKTLNWQGKAARINLFNFEEELLAIIEEIFMEIEENQKFVQDKKIIQSVLNYIEKNYKNGVTLEEAAAYVHLSPFYLSKLFKKELKINFVSYVMERKVEKAKDLLENTDLPVLNIAMELNYKEANYFSKVFKKVTGMTPSEYRKKKGKRNKKERLLFRKNYKILNGNWYI